MGPFRPAGPKIQTGNPGGGRDSHVHDPGAKPAQRTRLRGLRGGKHVGRHTLRGLMKDPKRGRQGPGCDSGTQNVSALGGDRTPDHCIKSATLLPLSYKGNHNDVSVSLVVVYVNVQKFG